MRQKPKERTEVRLEDDIRARIARVLEWERQQTQLAQQEQDEYFQKIQKDYDTFQLKKATIIRPVFEAIIVMFQEQGRDEVHISEDHSGGPNFPSGITLHLASRKAVAEAEEEGNSLPCFRLAFDSHQRVVRVFLGDTPRRKAEKALDFISQRWVQEEFAQYLEEKCLEESKLPIQTPRL
ncbi:MAG: hypothetical protein EPN97_11635 [Alphaproteobacteria bacterium]|nr:MAG: hypothetical protein EPN97_11635 [Alphaproteobacteria bacterium]